MAKRRWRSFTGCSVLVLMTMFGACAEHTPTVIEDRSVALVEALPEIRQTGVTGAREGDGVPPVGTVYIIKPGDTLYSVAFRLDIDYRTLASYNGIVAPYLIRVGQSLNTIPTALPDGASDIPNSAPASLPPVTSSNAIGANTPAKPSDADDKGSVQRPSSVGSNNDRPSRNYPVDRWIWPAKGGVARVFSEDLHKGIDLTGEKGDAVRATAAGIVVYAGTSVTGYGALLIVKHNDAFLSAYGHNDALLVAEGQWVEAGQLIAHMGSSGADAVKLHFEIRRNGRPVDPIGLLSSR
jgi:lipoprotein NlpD